MDFLNSILGFLGLIIGFFLSEISKLLTDKKENKKKLNKVLYHLLEIRHIFSTEILIDNLIVEYGNIIREVIPKEEIEKISKEEFDLALKQISGFIKQYTQENNPDLRNIENLSINYSQIIGELSEFKPILAYSLSGKYNLKEKMTKLNNFYSDIDNEIADPNVKIANIFNPIVGKEALKDLDENIKDISRMINKETLKSIELKISEMDKVDTKGMKEYLSNFINQIPKN